jgi:glutathione S-transferase
MTIITPTKKRTKKLMGLHLYHFSKSNCSMRVRMVLEEKNIPWTSHHLDLRKAENVTEDYFKIHPKGLVPALIHDDVVHIESTEIINYLDEAFPSPHLTPASHEDKKRMSDSMNQATDNHIHVKTYMFAHQIGASMSKTEQELTMYRQLQANTELLEFHAENSSAEGLSENRIKTATEILNDCFSNIEKQLGMQNWIASDSFSLADITWIPLYLTLNNAGFPFSDYPNILKWADTITSRPSFHKGITTWMDRF